MYHISGHHHSFGDLKKKRDCLEWKEIPGIKEKFRKTHIFDNS